MTRTAGAAVALLSLALAACGTAPTKGEPERVEYRTVNVPVPVACREEEPQRPRMPTEHLPTWASAKDVVLDEVVKASRTEIALREAYEIELRTALQNCKRVPAP